MSDPLISVIVPVYKVEPYLERCVSSIRKQTYQNLEIILVDDGSPDRCGQMCDALAAQDTRIRVIHKENGGLSSARNAGLDIMTGEYVGFVDSDDWIDENMYRSLLDLLVSSQAGMAACGMVIDYCSGHSYSTHNAHSIVLSVTDALKELTMRTRITNSVCDKLFHRTVFESIRMTPGVINEDFEIMPHCIEKAGRVASFPVPMYHYVMTPSSIMRGNFRPVRFTESDMSRKRVEYYGQTYPVLKKYAVAEHVEVCLNLIRFSEGAPDCVAQRKMLIKELPKVVSKDVFQVLTRKQKLKYIVCRISPWLYCRMVRIFSKQ